MVFTETIPASTGFTAVYVYNIPVVQSRVTIPEIAVIIHRSKQMPALENAKYERMAQRLAEGKTREQSYIDAGFAPANTRSGASKVIKANPVILERRDELLEQRVAAQRAAMTGLAIEEDITLQAHLQVLAKLRDEARALGQYG